MRAAVARGRWRRRASDSEARWPVKPEALPGVASVSCAVLCPRHPVGARVGQSRGLLRQDLSSCFTFGLRLGRLPPHCPPARPRGPALGDGSPRPRAGCLPGPSRSVFLPLRAAFGLCFPCDGSGDCCPMCTGSVSVTSSPLAAVRVRGVRATARMRGAVGSVLGTSRLSVHRTTQRGRRGVGTGGGSLGVRAALGAWVRESPGARVRVQEGTPPSPARRGGGTQAVAAVKWGEQARGPPSRHRLWP